MRPLQRPTMLAELPHRAGAVGPRRAAGHGVDDDQVSAAPRHEAGRAVAPSLATHPFLSKVISEDVLTDLARREAFGRGAAPWEVANVIVFLASDYASYLTGEVVSVSSQHP